MAYSLRDYPVINHVIEDNQRLISWNVSCRSQSPSGEITEGYIQKIITQDFQFNNTQSQQLQTFDPGAYKVLVARGNCDLDSLDISCSKVLGPRALYETSELHIASFSKGKWIINDVETLYMLSSAIEHCLAYLLTPDEKYIYDHKFKPIRE